MTALTLMGALLLALSSSPVDAATSIPDGNTLVTAVASASNGAVLQLNGGDYYITEPLDISGKAITIDGTGSITIVSDLGSTMPQDIIYVKQGGGLTLNDMTVHGGNPNTAGIENDGTNTLNDVNITKTKTAHPELRNACPEPQHHRQDLGRLLRRRHLLQ